MTLLGAGFPRLCAAIQAAGGKFLEYPDLWTINLRIQVCVILLFFAGSTVRVWYLFQKQD